MDIDQSPERLWATVEDEKDDDPLRVVVDLDEEGNLSLDCECTKGREGVCGHQVAALCAYADLKDEEDQILTAADTALKNRIKRARTEVSVKHLSGKPWFGEWEAISSGSATHYSQRYRVTIRSLLERTNICNCPDFLNNQLGTCKHIEAVLHKLQKRRDRARIRRLPPPASYVYLAWDVEDAPRLCVRRAPSVVDDLAAVVDRLFDARGRFTGRLPDDFFRFAEQVANRTDMVVGEQPDGHGGRRRCF
jgi:hypothetical protein